eukprot:7379299-Prymnesium_polylepis.1
MVGTEPARRAVNTWHIAPRNRGSDDAACSAKTTVSDGMTCNPMSSEVAAHHTPTGMPRNANMTAGTTMMSGTDVGKIKGHEWRGTQELDSEVVTTPADLSAMKQASAMRTELQPAARELSERLSQSEGEGESEAIG